MLSLALIWQRASRILERLETGATRPPTLARFSYPAPSGETIALEVPMDPIDENDPVKFGRRAALVWVKFLAEQKERTK